MQRQTDVGGQHQNQMSIFYFFKYGEQVIYSAKLRLAVSIRTNIYFFLF
jgi:hypothetical protein